MELENSINEIENKMAAFAQDGAFDEVKKLEFELNQKKIALEDVTSEWESLIA